MENCILNYIRKCRSLEQENAKLRETVEAQRDLIDKMIIDRIAITDIVETIEKYYNTKITLFPQEGREEVNS